jgi:copper chaperone CopZ
MAQTIEQIYSVNGMSCEHCRGAVAEEVGALAGVDAAEVDLAAGKLTVRGDVSEAAVRGAVEEAGYELAQR